MQESTVYRSIQKERDRAIALNLLREDLSMEIIARVTGLSRKFGSFSSRSTSPCKVKLNGCNDAESIMSDRLSKHSFPSKIRPLKLAKHTVEIDLTQ
jgi:hypothetical protein